MLTRRSARRWLGVALLLALGPSWAASISGLSAPAGLLAAALAMLAAKSLSLQEPASLIAALIVPVLLAGVARVLKARRDATPSALVARSTRHGRHRPSAAAAKLPGGYRPEALMAMASEHFLQLQAAWDAGDLEALQVLTTEDMLAELRTQLPDREAGANRTDVVSLRADLLSFDELQAAYVVSVEFSGMIREHAGRGAEPFRELWMLARPKEGKSGWLLARHQALL